jgi:hypothetical protein
MGHSICAHGRRHAELRAYRTCDHFVINDIFPGPIVVAFIREGSKGALAQMRFHTESPGGLGPLGSSSSVGWASNSNFLFLEFQFIFCDCDQFFFFE